MFNPALRPTIFAFCALAPLAAGVRAADAQGVVIARSGAGAGAGVMIHNALPITDEAIRALVAKYEPSLLDDQADANILTVVLDNANNYVKSATRKATVVHAVQGDGGVTVVGGGAGGVVIRRTSSGEAPAEIASGAVASFSRTTGEPSNGFMNTGVDAADIEAIATKRYEAGAITHGQLIVTVLRLK